MPFKSEAQRRYLWAREPKIARDWTNKYGSRIQKDTGGITRIPFGLGGDALSWLLRFLINKGDDDEPNFLQNLASGLGERFKNRPIPEGKWTPRLSQRGVPTGQGYTAAELNRMNALGGWYSEPARAERRRQGRIENMLTRREEGKAISEANLAALTGKRESDIQRGSYTAPTRDIRSEGPGITAPSGMHGGVHYARGGIANLWQG
jgi:hypothetical protein